MNTIFLAALEPHLSVVLDHLIAALAVVLGIVAPFIGAYLVLVLKKKTGLELSKDLEDKFQKALLDGIAYAEEWAHKKLAAGETPASAEKLDKALTFVEAELTRLGIPAMAQDKLKALLEAKLGITRL
jgi:hypothetical protein